MKSFDNALQVFSLTRRNNCRECHRPTCLAFAGAVFTGSQKLSDCPYISPDILEQYGKRNAGNARIDENITTAVIKLKSEIASIDLSSVAEQLGGIYQDGWLTLKVMGKNYSVADNGDISTDIHVIPWISLPVYNYIIRAGSVGVSGRWVPLRELPSGKDWFRLFGQRCEKPLKKVADNSPDLFEDIIRLFNGRQIDNSYEADISVVLHPLPKLPMLICYWRSEQDMESDCHLFFDESAEDYLDINSINSIGSGFVSMLEKITRQHS